MEETAQQLRCIMIYRMMEYRNVWGKHGAVFNPDACNMRAWFVSTDLAKKEPESYRRAGSWFEIEPYSPCLAFRFDSKWLVVIRDSFKQFHVEQGGEILYCDKWTDERVTINWKGKTIEQIKDIFFYSGLRGMIRIADDPTGIQGASCMADATPESFVTLKSRPVDQWYLTPFEDSTADYYLEWEDDSPHNWSVRDEEAKELDCELAKFFPAESEIIVDQAKFEQEPQNEFQNQAEKENETMELEKSVLLWKEGSPNVEDFKENEQCLVTIMNQLAMFTKRSGEWIMGGDSAFGGYRKINQDTAKLVTRFCPVVDATKIESNDDKLHPKLQWYEGPLNADDFSEGDQCLVLVNKRRLLWLTVLGGYWHIKYSGSMYADLVGVNDEWMKDRCFFYCPIKSNELNFIDLWRGSK